LFFTFIPILALLGNHDRENCLIYVDTEGSLLVAHCGPQAVNTLSEPWCPGSCELSIVGTHGRFRSHADLVCK